MSLLERAGLRVLRCFDPETAHSLAMTALKSGLAPLHSGPVKSPRLKTTLAGLALENPIGLAAGFDKNAEAIAPLVRSGFGYIEVGAATPRPQPGNSKPRLFRLTEDRAAINRFGFNNQGIERIAARLASTQSPIPVGLNLGANKDTENKAEDFAKVFTCVGDAADFVTVNVSSPNTEKLRDLQGKAALQSLLNHVVAVKTDNSLNAPIFLKIAPDLTDEEIAEIVEVAEATKINGIIATNTTLSRDGLNSAHKSETGGLSGAPLYERSTKVLAQIATMTDLPLVGVGGISSAEQAYTKIKAGASAVQLYTAMVYEGISLAARIAKDLDILLERDGFANVADAVGSQKEHYT